MELVIKVSEDFINKMNSIKDDRELSYAQLLTVYRGFHGMLNNGSPLPEEHGELVDYEELKNIASEYGAYAEEILSHIKPKTLIEADSESEET